MNPPNLPTVSFYTITLREVIHHEALIYTMPTVAAGGGHILNIDFLLLQICQGSDGTKGCARKYIRPSDNEEEEEGEQGEETIPKQGKAASVAEALADTRPNWRCKVQFPPLARSVARRVCIVRKSKRRCIE